MKNFLKSVCILIGCFTIILFSSFIRAEGFTIHDLKISESGKITWSTENMPAGTTFELYSLRWNKRYLIAKVKAKSTDGNYEFQGDTACGLYRILVKATGPQEAKAEGNVPNQPEVKLLTQFTSVLLEFDRRTGYEIYDQYGNLEMEGCAKEINVTKLAKGAYFINFGNKTEEFRRK